MVHAEQLPGGYEEGDAIMDMEELDISKPSNERDINHESQRATK